MLHTPAPCSRRTIGIRGALFVAGLCLAAPPALAQAIPGGFDAKYVVTGMSDCLEVVPPATFDANFRATDLPVFHTNAYMMGVRVFNKDGTGQWQVLEGVSTFTAVPPDAASPGSSSASSWKVQSRFTYVVDPDTSIITMTMVPGSYSQLFTSGGRNGQTLTQDVFDLYGVVTPGGEGFSAVSKGAVVETRSFSNGDVRQDVCARSYTGHRVFGATGIRNANL